MLVKLAFAMQRLKKYLKECCHDQQRWGKQLLEFMGGRAVMRRDIEIMGGPPTRENPVQRHFLKLNQLNVQTFK